MLYFTFVATLQAGGKELAILILIFSGIWYVFVLCIPVLSLGISIRVFYFGRLIIVYSRTAYGRNIAAYGRNIAATDRIAFHHLIDSFLSLLLVYNFFD